ncbi:hypothetical protein C8Q72DRAFT_584866 [Fomitopsis betulina]|nr:hypothetical protein C8Q72DRAFT_584866 [Fomitopsis betulina]
MRVSRDELDYFRAIADASITNELDLTQGFMGQDESALQRHFANVERIWQDASKYEGAWPILHYTQYWFAEKRKHIHKEGLTRTHYHDGPPTNLKFTTSVHVQDGHTRGDSEVQSRREPSSASSTLNTPGTPRKLPQSAASPDNTSQPTPKRRTPESGRANSPFDSVLCFLRSLNPSLEHLAPRFRAAGIKDAQRLRVVAGWEVRKQWIAEVVELDPFEKEVLRIALDEVERGIRKLQ